LKNTGFFNQDQYSHGATGETTKQMQTETTFTDANWDFGVDMVNFATILDASLIDDTPTTNWNEDCDLDGSGVIDTGDLNIFAEHWLCD